MIESTVASMKLNGCEKPEAKYPIAISKETVEININSSEDDDEKSVENDLVGHLDDVDLKEVKLQQLEEGITKLNSEQKICVELFYLQNKSYVEVAEITGYELNQVKSYIQNGKRNLKIYLEKKNV